MGRAKGRAFWEQVVADAAECGSQSQAARRHGVSQSGLGYWVRKLAAEEPRRPEPRLLPVRLTSPITARRCGLVIGDLRVDFDEGTEPGYLAALATALRAC
jgi:transposase-like protein